MEAEGKTLVMEDEGKPLVMEDGGRTLELELEGKTTSGEEERTGHGLEDSVKERLEGGAVEGGEVRASEEAREDRAEARTLVMIEDKELAPLAKEDTGQSSTLTDVTGDNCPLAGPPLHLVLRTGVPLAEPEGCEDTEEEEERTGEVMAAEEEPEKHSSVKTKLTFDEGDSKEVDEDGEDEEEEELILSSNFVDAMSERSGEGSAFLPPLTMATPLKSAAPPLPLVASTPAGAPRPHLAPPSPLPPPEGPPSLPGLVSPGGSKTYDYLLKVLLVGDSDVGKGEILAGLEDGAQDSPYASTGAAYKTTVILIDGKRVKLQLWDTSGQGRFCTIIRSYSRGAQGILLVYDITSRWSFEGMDRWVKEVEEHAPGIPKVLVGNRLHLAFNRQVEQEEAEKYAERHHMGFYEVSPLVNFNITESFQELCRMALRRNGMERLWRSRQVTSLHELCCHAIVANMVNTQGIDRLPLPDSIKANLKSYALTTATNTTVTRSGYKALKEARRKRERRPADAVAAKCASVSRKSCSIS